MKKTTHASFFFPLILSCLMLVTSCGTQKKAIIEKEIAPSEVSDEETISEKVTTISEKETIETYNVICGSYKLLNNAQTLANSLRSEGYHPILVINPEKQTYRVVLSTFDSKEQAVSARNDFKKRYSDNPDFQKSWILKLIK